MMSLGDRTSIIYSSSLAFPIYSDCIYWYHILQERKQTDRGSLTGPKAENEVLLTHGYMLGLLLESSSHPTLPES